MATVHYVLISAQNEPSRLGLGLDEQERDQVAFDVLCYKRPSTSYEDELLGILEDAGVGVVGENLFAGAKVRMPGKENPGPFLMLYSGAGGPPSGTHDQGRAAWRHPGAHLVVHAADPRAADQMAHAAYLALIAIVNADVPIPEEAT